MKIQHDDRFCHAHVCLRSKSFVLNLILMRFSNGLKDDCVFCYNCTIRNKETIGLYSYILTSNTKAYMTWIFIVLENYVFFYPFFSFFCCVKPSRETFTWCCWKKPWNVLSLISFVSDIYFYEFCVELIHINTFSINISYSSWTKSMDINEFNSIPITKIISISITGLFRFLAFSNDLFSSQTSILVHNSSYLIKDRR